MHCKYCHQVHVANYKCNAQYVANTQEVMANTVNTVANGTYRYRDADKRRAYMRDYMRRKRVPSKETLLDLQKNGIAANGGSEAS
jgi:ABC-type iron transport system FetAB ATPase subunit